MVPEIKFTAWLTAGFAEYQSNPLLVESVFWDQGQMGQPTNLAPTLLFDSEKFWTVNEYSGGILRWAGGQFPIVSNTAQQLTLEGDPSVLPPTDNPYYQIVPKEAQGLTQLLQTQKMSVSSAFNQVPTEMPALTIRLEKDAQADTYVGESRQQYVVDGVEVDINTTAVTGSYLFSVWAINREAALWLYAWLLHYIGRSIQQFNSWGLYDIAVSGSDLDPALQYLAERTYNRHLLLTATRTERAVNTRQPVVWIESWCLKLLTNYQTWSDTIAAM